MLELLDAVGDAALEVSPVPPGGSVSKSSRHRAWRSWVGVVPGSKAIHALPGREVQRTFSQLIGIMEFSDGVPVSEPHQPRGQDVLAAKRALRRLPFTSSSAMSSPVAFFIRATITRAECLLMARSSAARERASDDGRRSPVTRPAPGTLAPRQRATQATGPPSAILPVVEAESQQPSNFSLYLQDRVRGGEFFFQSSDLRLELAHLGTEGVVLGRFRATLLRRQALRRAAPARLAPCGQMRGVQTLTAKQPSHLARAAYIGPLPQESATDTRR